MFPLIDIFAEELYRSLVYHNMDVCFFPQANTLRRTEKYGPSYLFAMCYKPHAESNNIQNNFFHLGFWMALHASCLGVTS